MTYIFYRDIVIVMNINSEEKTKEIAQFVLSMFKGIYPYWYNDMVKEKKMGYFENDYLNVIPLLEIQCIRLVYKGIKERSFEEYKSKPPSAYDFEVLTKEKASELIDDVEKIKMVNVNKCAILILLKQKIPEHLQDFEEEGKILASSLKNQ